MIMNSLKKAEKESVVISSIKTYKQHSLILADILVTSEWCKYIVLNVKKYTEDKEILIIHTLLVEEHSFQFIALFVILIKQVH